MSETPAEREQRIRLIFMEKEATYTAALYANIYRGELFGKYTREEALREIANIDPEKVAAYEAWTKNVSASVSGLWM